MHVALTMVVRVNADDPSCGAIDAGVLKQGRENTHLGL